MANPLVNVFVINMPGCEYPAVKILFDNGNAVEYIPAPKVKYFRQKPIGIFDRRVGYQYQPEYIPKHIKNRRDR